MADRVGVNLGCGTDHLDDAVNVDVDPSVNPDVVCDLQETPWPFPDDRFEWAHARHVLEHLDPVPWDELQRVIQPHGFLKITHPIGWTRFEDSTHQQFWTVDTAVFLTEPKQHAHEAPLDGKLLTHSVDWHLWPPSPLRWLTTYAREFVFGPGAWMGQVTGLYGEVTAVYELE